jgi:hypothetical protein
MIKRIPRRLSVAFNRADAPAATIDMTSPASDGGQEVNFVAAAEDCVLFGRTYLDGERLTDMLNTFDEIALVGVTVERFDGEPPMTVDEVVVRRDELVLVHASGPRGDRARRQKTAQQHVAIQMGRYRIRGFYHGLPGTDPLAAILRRKVMVPITNARVMYTIGGEEREVRVETVIVNRDQIDWIEAVEPDRAEFPLGPTVKAPVPEPT